MKFVLTFRAVQLAYIIEGQGEPCRSDIHEEGLAKRGGIVTRLAAPIPLLVYAKQKRKQR